MSEEEMKNTETAEATEEKAETKTADTSANSTPDAEVEVPAKFKKIVAEIEDMSVLDLHELVKVFEQKFGVSAAAVVATGGGGDAGDGDDDSGLVNVILEDGGASKIQVIKVVKEILGLGLKETKDFVDGAPKVLKEGVLKEEADTIKGQLEEAGAKVTVK